MFKSLGRIARQLALTAGVALSAIGNVSHAAVFVTDWDPLFNPSFPLPTFGWKGAAHVDVDNACIAPGSTVFFPSGCGTATLLDYSLVWYDPFPVISIGGQFGVGPGLPDPDPGAVSFDSFGVANGMLLSTPIIGVAETFGAITYDVTLNFTLSGPVLTLTDQAFPFTSYTSGFGGPLYEPVVHWSQVPEPTSLLLFGAALAGLGITRRRKA